MIKSPSIGNELCDILTHPKKGGVIDLADDLIAWCSANKLGLEITYETCKVLDANLSVIESFESPLPSRALRPLIARFSVLAQSGPYEGSGQVAETYIVYRNNRGDVLLRITYGTLN